MRHVPRTLLEGLTTSAAGQAAASAGLAALAGWAVSTGHGSLMLTLAITVAGTIGLLRWPVVTIFALLILCQELNPAVGFEVGGNGLLFVGHQLYFTTFNRISLLTLVAVLACARVSLIDPPRRPPLRGVLLVTVMGAWYAGSVWVRGSALTSAINQDGRYALLFVLSFVIGAKACEAREWRHHGIEVMQWLFTIAALLGAYLDATGQGQAQSGVNIIFYDSALGAVAGAVVLAVALAPAAVRNWRVWWLGGAALIVVVLSSRRNVWAAIIVGLLVGLAVARNRAKLVLRGLAGIGVILVVVAIVAPTVMTEIGHQFSAIWEATQGSASDASVQGHLSDVSTGWKAVLASPITGVGPSGHLPGLIVENGGTLYIHNQILESWLRFGLIGALLVICLQVTLVMQAIRLLRRHADDLAVSWAAFLLIMAPVAMLTAPFFTETQRWPALLGLAAGLLAARSVRLDQGGSRGDRDASVATAQAPPALLREA